MTPPQVELHDDKLVLTGELRIGEAPSVWRALHELADRRRDGSLDIDLTGASIVDGAIMSLLVEVRAKLARRGVRSEIVGAREAIRRIVHLYRGDEPPAPEGAPEREGALARLGQATERIVGSVRRAALFLGELATSIASAFRDPALVDWRAVPRLAERAGVDGIPIVLLLNFLVGFVMAFQSARQLQLYGANVYVADVVGISVTRELSPLMTAIIMSGRSGASFAAELGTMRVSEEIDALRTMGFGPIPYLALPRIASLALVAPVLTLFGDIVGVFGGAVVAASSLDVGARSYLAELRTAVFAADVWTGLVKSVAFGGAIGIIGCQQGFSTRGAAAEVGRSTTATVVLCLFTVVIVDTLVTLFFRMFGT